MACKHENLLYIEVLESKYAMDVDWENGKPYAEQGLEGECIQDSEMTENYFRCQDCDARWAVGSDGGGWVPIGFPEVE
jgi:hypothetical protein